MLLGACIDKSVSGNYCDLYYPVDDVDSEQVFVNNAVYDCICLGKDLDYC